MVRSQRSLCALAAAIVLLAALGAAPRSVVLAAPSILTVTTTADFAPPCGTALSLRCALAKANTDRSGDTITFHIPATDPGCTGNPVVCTITPSSALPALTASSTTMNGYSQLGASPNTNPLSAGDNASITIRLDGSRVPAGADGLVVAGSQDRITGLAVTGFGTLFYPSITGGVGVHLTGSSATGDVVQGNFIGLLPDGHTTGPNQLDGVAIDNAGGDVIGGSAPGAANVISGNGLCSSGDCTGIGVTINSGSGSAVASNYIGTAPSGAAALGNLATGVVVLSRNNTIGGTSGGNVISANGGDGLLVGSSGNRIAGNRIGTTATGMAGLGNHSHGIDVQAPTNTITGNLISANGDTGLVLLSAGNTVQGNRVGTTASGTAALGNGFAPSGNLFGQLINGTDGIVVCSGPNTIGGSSSGAGNLVSGNAGDGISLVSSGNLVQGNTVGTTADGSAALPNGVDGIGSKDDLFKGTGFCQQAPQTGGNTNTIATNLISGNTGSGVDLVMSNGNALTDNRIGTNAAGTAGVANSGDGVILGAFCDDNICHGSSTNTISGNVISANGGNGVRIDGTGHGVSNSIQGNHIGTDISGTIALGNHANGILLVKSAVNDRVGGTAAGAGNTIAQNGQAGVLVGASSGDTGTHSAIQQNAIFANGGLGIDLAPQGTVNCSTTPPGPNDYTLCPVINTATASTVGGTACAACNVEVYLATGESDDHGHGEGKTFLGSTIADSTGTWSLALPAGQVVSGQLVTATATTPVAFNRAAETSEFAANAIVP